MMRFDKRRSEAINLIDKTATSAGRRIEASSDTKICEAGGTGTFVANTAAPTSTATAVGTRLEMSRVCRSPNAVRVPASPPL